MPRPSTVVLSLVAALALGCVARAAASPAAASPLLRIGSTVTFSTLDPAKNSGTGGAPGLLEGLFGFKHDGSLQPELALSVTRPGAAVYVYHLRHGVRFWDGTEMTSRDVANALNYQRYPTFQSSSDFKEVKSVVAVDRYTVAVTLRHVDASWNGTKGVVFEKKFADAHRGSMGNPGVLIEGTGPWEPVSFDATRGLELKANPHWWGGTVPFAHITYSFFSDQTSEALAFRAGEIDVADPIALDGRAFASAAGARVVSVPSFFEDFIAMDTQVAPWNDVHVRRAVAYAINRPDLIAARGGDATPVTTLISPGQLESIGSRTAVAALVKSLPQYPYSPARAAAELAKSAYPNGFSTSIDAPALAGFAEIDQAIAAELQKIHIKLQVNSVPLGQWVSELFGPKDKIGIQRFGVGLTAADPSTYPAFLLGSKNARDGGSNIANYVAPAVDVLLQQGTRTQNPAKRLAVYARLLQRLATDVPYVPLFNEDVDLVLSSRFAWPTFGPYDLDGSWPLYIKPRS
jgi:peptide/nickel transport system substrate-binding protein